jgi:hypothetical protein
VTADQFKLRHVRIHNLQATIKWYFDGSRLSR